MAESPAVKAHDGGCFELLIGDWRDTLLSIRESPVQERSWRVFCQDPPKV
jgi:hypothetical protein